MFGLCLHIHVWFNVHACVHVCVCVCVCVCVPAYQWWVGGEGEGANVQVSTVSQCPGEHLSGPEVERVATNIHCTTLVQFYRSIQIQSRD